MSLFDSIADTLLSLLSSWTGLSGSGSVGVNVAPGEKGSLQLFSDDRPGVEG